MKRTLFFVSILLIAFASMAQEQAVNKTQAEKSKKFYIRIGLGGGVSTSSSFDMMYKYSGDAYNSTVSIVPVGLGNGFNGSAAFGYWFNKYVGVELAVSEFLGLPVKCDSLATMIGASKTTIKIRGSMLSVMPSVLISAGLQKVNPYARFGLQIGVLPDMVSKYTVNNASTNPPSVNEITTYYYGGVALGYNAAGGVDFNVSKLITFYVELQFTHATWSPNHSQIMKYTLNGEDKLSSLTTREKQTNFVWDKNIPGIIDETQPRQELRKTVPFSTVSINLGIKFKL